MIVGVIGSGAIGPDLAYGFLSALSRESGAKVYLHDIRQEALDAGVARIHGYLKKGVSRGKISKKAATVIGSMLAPTLEIGDLADCEYVLEAATEHLPIKKRILAGLEAVVSADCLIGFATSGLPRAQIAATTKHPERCFVNHPFFPAWRSPPVEVVLSGHEGYGERMIATLKKLGKVPIVTADVACFAADDVFCNYCSEAARIVHEGLATPAQVDQIVNDAIGGGGPFNVLDLTSGNLLTVHCQELMRDAPTGSEWFEPPPNLTSVGDDPWHDRKAPGDPSCDDATKQLVLDRILAVLLARTLFVVDHGICSPAEMNWMTSTALGFHPHGLLEVAEELGAEKVADLCDRYAAANPGFELPPSVRERTLPDLRSHVLLERDGDLALVTIWRPETLNALNARVMRELGDVIDELAADDSVRGVVLTGYQGALAGADIGDLMALETVEDGVSICRRGQRILDRIAAMEKPVVAALNGPVLGGGAELSMACHARVVGPRLHLGQPEVNLGIVPGYGGTQRLPRLVGFERAWRMLRLAESATAQQACEWGWAAGRVEADPVAGARRLIARHLEGEVRLSGVDPAPMDLPEPPALDIGRRSRCIDAIMVKTLLEGLALPLDRGLELEMQAVGACTQTVDFDIGMKNFQQNGPRVPAEFLHE